MGYFTAISLQSNHEQFRKIWAVSPNGTKGTGIYRGAVTTGTVTSVDYPTDSLDGNDDSQVETTTRAKPGENSNPYDELPESVEKGWLYDGDGPGNPVALNSPRPIGSSLEVKLQFKQFCRVEIAKKWYRISDLDAGLWRHHAKLTKVRDASSTQGPYDGQGFSPRTGNSDW